MYRHPSRRFDTDLLDVPSLVGLLPGLFLLVLRDALLFEASPRLLALASWLGLLAHVESLRARSFVDRDRLPDEATRGRAVTSSGRLWWSRQGGGSRSICGSHPRHARISSRPGWALVSRCLPADRGRPGSYGCSGSAHQHVVRR